MVMAKKTETTRMWVGGSILFVLVGTLAGVGVCEGGCVKQVSVTVQNRTRSLEYSLAIEDTPDCKKKEEWDAVLEPCDPNDDSYSGSLVQWEKVRREGGTIGATFHQDKGWRRLVVKEGRETRSHCFTIVGLSFTPSIYMEFTLSKIDFKLARDPRVKNATFNVHPGYPGGDCDRQTLVYQKSVDESFAATIYDTFNASDCFCFSIKLESYGPQLSYPSDFNFKNCTPDTKGNSDPEREHWDIGVIVGGCVVVIVVIGAVISSLKKWRPVSSYSPEKEKPSETTEVFVLYTPDQANRRQMKDLLAYLSCHSWKVTDLNEFSHERCKDETSWVERLTGDGDSGVKVVVVESPALHTLCSSILNTKVNGELDHDQSFLRFAMRQILINKLDNYNRIFTVRFTEDNPQDEDKIPGEDIPVQPGLPLREEQREEGLLVNDRLYILPGHRENLLAGLKGQEEDKKKEEMNVEVKTRDPVMV